MILTADLHLRSTKPRARIDDYFKAQEEKFDFILRQAVESPPLLVAGDFFDRPKPGEFLIRWVIEKLRLYKVEVIVTPGQHDMPYHSLDRLNESGLGVLHAAGVVKVPLMNGTPWHETEEALIFTMPFGAEVDPRQIRFHEEDKRTKILLWHHMVIDKPLWPGQVADKSLPILIKYPQFDLIVTGDNHQSFSYATIDKEGLPPNQHFGKTRWLINPGSMMRMTSAQANHQPYAFQWDDEILEQIFLPIRPSEEALDLAIIEQEKERDAKIGAFVERLHTGYEVALSFEKNLEEHLRTEQVDDEVKKIIWEVCE